MQYMEGIKAGVKAFSRKVVWDKLFTPIKNNNTLTFYNQ